MGIVYSAFDPDLDRKVALKVLRKSRDPASRARLLREAQSMAKLSHPNVVTVFEVATEGGRDFVSMEYVDGQNLDDWQKEEHEVAEILRVYRQAGEGLAAAHRAGLVHRDFKPHNVLIDKEGRVRVTDFGIAQQLTEPVYVDPDAATPDPDSEPEDTWPGEHLTRTGTVMGTPAYMAPEQHLAEPTDARTDQFSFCVALFEALAGTRPYKGEKYADLKALVTEGTVPTLPESVVVSGKLRSALATGMAKERNKRHGSLDELLLFLEPPARRGQTLPFVALIAASLVAVFVFGLNASKERPVCEPDPSRLDGIWDQDVRGKMRTAFALTQVDGSDAVFEKFESIADRYGDELVAMRVDICEAERGPRAASDKIILKRMTCLLSRRQKFLHLTTSFSNANRSGVNRVVEAASELPAVIDCADPDALESDVSLPPADQKEEVQALRITLSEASSEAEAGHVKDAIQKGLTVRDRARELNYKPLLAEVYVELGDLYRQEARMNDAEEAFEDSILAAEESGYTEFRARGLVGLTKVLASGSSRFDEARRNARRAKAAVERWGDAPLLRIEIERALAHAQMEEGKIKEALELLVLALDWYRNHKDAKPVRIGMLQENIATLLLEEGRYDEAHEIARDSYNTVRTELADGNPKIYKCLATLTNALRMRGDYDEARRLDKINRNFWEGSSGDSLLMENDEYEEASRSVRGTVLDESGAPVHGATVVCGATVIADGRYLDSSWSAHFDALLRKRVTQSKSDGSFHCEETSAKDIVVVAEDQGHGRSELVKVPEGAGAGDVKLILRATGTLSGMVTKDGKPAKPQAVQVLPASNMVASPPHAILAFLRADGSYRIERLAPGKYIVFTGPRSLGHKSSLQSQEVEIVSNKSVTLNFDQSGGDAVLEVTVLGEGGAPMPSAQVMLARGHLESGNAAEFNKVVLATDLKFRSHFIEGGKMLKMESVESGLHSVCVAPIGGDYRDPEHMKKFSRETMDRIMIYCQDVTVPAGETTVVEALVPAWKPLITIEKSPADKE
jgi:serine/threonine protein kinase